MEKFKDYLMSNRKLIKFAYKDIGCFKGMEKSFLSKFSMMIRNNGIKNVYLHIFDKAHNKKKDEFKNLERVISNRIEDFKNTENIESSHLTYNVMRYFYYLAKLMDCELDMSCKSNNGKSEIKSCSSEIKDKVKDLKINLKKDGLKHNLFYDNHNYYRFEKKTRNDKKDFEFEFKFKKYELKRKDDEKSRVELRNELDNINKLQNKILEQSKDKLLKDNGMRFKIKDKLIIGLGEADYREVSIKVDHLTGIPYIPASTIKGAFRRIFTEDIYQSDKKVNYKLKRLIETVKEVDDNFDKNTKDNIILEYFRKYLFGSEAKESDAERGSLIFFDTYPNGEFKIETDIITPHYAEYYSDGKAPTDDIDPKIIKFYVLTDTEFKFNMVISNDFKETKDYLYDKEVREYISSLFSLCLGNYGLGAKKTSGYGLLEEVDE
ncbi:type III-B CRISPR module RAMP protein Cmr6 [Halonatronum saccharophilum]|uniref:type III-B CRISPR module RAMP protein Cmr6 n=1 Tax=Halonatronum saccharophilum TaxID=150060 RepID=UPI0004822FAE|nr:type III-B CRISPR module RAMP protein Cmr6 [Halonatronum saccharophilum]